jgi:hypothetical protein
MPDEVLTSKGSSPTLPYGEVAEYRRPFPTPATLSGEWDAGTLTPYRDSEESLECL